MSSGPSAAPTPEVELHTFGKVTVAAANVNHDDGGFTVSHQADLSPVSPKKEGEQADGKHDDDHEHEEEKEEVGKSEGV
jgi:hypothetical protein